MWNMPDFGRSNRIPNLDAKLHFGYDPNTEFKEQSNLFSAVRFNSSEEKHTSVLEQLMNSISNAVSGLWNDNNVMQNTNNNTQFNQEGNSINSNPYLPGFEGNGASGNGFSTGDEAVNGFGGFGGGDAGFAGRSALGLESSNVNITSISLPSPPTISNPPITPDNPQIPPNNPAPLAAPVVNGAPPLSINENGTAPIGIQVTADPRPGTVTTIVIGNVPSGAVLSAGINNGDGTWTLTPAQLVGLTLTPAPYASGDYTLSVTAISTLNGQTANGSGQIEISVEGVATAPMLSTSGASGDENTQIPLQISAALIDTDGSEILSIVISGLPVGSSLSAGVNNGDGSWILTPAQLAGLNFTPPLHGSGDYHLTVTATSSENGSVASVSDDLLVSVAGIATAPLLNVMDAAGDEDTAIPLNINAALVDTDGSEILSIIISDMPNGAVLSAGINNGDGTWTLTPAQLVGLTLTPPPFASGEIQLTVTATSSENGTTAQTIASLNVMVDGVANEPILTVQPAAGNENTAIALQIDAQLVVNDGSETLSIIISDVPNGAVLSAGVNNGDGSWTLTSAQLVGLTITPPLYASGNFNLTVTAIATEDGHTATNIENLIVSVAGVATPPTLNVMAASGDEDTAIPLSINASLLDTDGSETLSVLISGMPAGSSLSAGIDNGDGSWTLTPAQLTGLTITPPLHASGSYTLVVSAISSENGTTAQTDESLTLTVNGVATSPILDVTASIGSENAPVPLVIDAALVDADGSETLSILIAGVPPGAVLSAGIDNGDGTWTLVPAQLAGLTITPLAGWNGAFSLTVTATSSENGTQASVTETLPVIVEGVANTPSLAVSAAAGNEDSAISLVINAALTDLDGSETLSIVIDNVPDGAVLSAGVYAGNGKWSLSMADLIGLNITPPENYSGVIHLQVTAVSTENDGDIAELSLPLDVTVNPVADIPDLHVVAAVGLEDQDIALNISTALTDIDTSEILSIRISNVPTGAVLSAGINLGGGIWVLSSDHLAGLTIRPPMNSNTDFNLNVTATATEGSGATISQSAVLTVNVIGDADKPSVAALTTAGAINTQVNVTISGALVDGDGSESLSYVVTGIPDGFALNQGYNNGNNSWTLTQGQLTGLKLISPYNFEGQLNLKAYAVANENDGDVQRSDPVSFAVRVGSYALGLNIDLDLGIGVGVGGVAVGVGVGVGAGIGVNLGSLLAPNGVVLMEDSSVMLSDAPNLLSGLSAFVLGLLAHVKVTGIPNDFSLSAGSKQPDGSWLLTTAQLFNLYLNAGPNSDSDFTMVFSAELLTLVSLPLASTPVHTVGIADLPSLSVMNATGDEGSAGIAVSITSALTDLDGSETLSITIKDLPVGFTLNHGINNGDGTWSIPLAQLSVLQIIPPINFSGDITYTVVAVSTERNGDASAITATGHVHVNAVADAAIITAMSVDGTEDNPVSLNLGVALTDTDGSESIVSILISGLPTGGSLTHATDNYDGSWSVSPADVGLVQFVPPNNWHGDVNLGISVVSQEAANGSHITATATLPIHIDAHADTPTIFAADEVGMMNDPIALNILADLTDTDGSEHLSIVIHGVPEGGILSAGLHNDDGSWTVQKSELTGLMLQPPRNFSGDLNLSAVAHSIETSNGDTASNTVMFNIHVDAPMAMLGMMGFMDDDFAMSPFAADNAYAPPPEASSGDSFDHAFHTP